MVTHASPGTVGSAERWGRLWGARPADWALSEDQQTPTYEAALAHAPISPGDRVLDVGCGVGSFLRLVVDRGGEPFGIDASAALIEFAHERLPDADLRDGEMEALPYEADSFDLVAGFNSFFFANDIVAALAEARRVAKPGASVVIQVWGRHECCDFEAMKSIARTFFPPRPADAPADPDLSAPGVLEGLVAASGLTIADDFVTSWSAEFPDEQTLRRAMLAVAGLALLAGPDREHELGDAIARGMEQYRTPDGGYSLRNEYRIVVSRA